MQKGYKSKETIDRADHVISLKISSNFKFLVNSPKVAQYINKINENDEIQLTDQNQKILSLAGSKYNRPHDQSKNKFNFILNFQLICLRRLNAEDCVDFKKKFERERDL